jgi:general nucleoside transport system permease protein
MRPPRLDRYRLLEILAPLTGFFLSLLILLAMVMAVGESPQKAAEAIWRYALSSTAKLATIASLAIPLFLAGLAVAVAFQAGVFNIGVEGQYFMGGFMAALAGIYLNLPAPLHLVAVVLAAMLGGALWAFIPAFLKTYRGTHEVITTIMFNNIGLALANWLVNVPFSGLTGMSNLEPQTARIADTAFFHKLNFLFRAAGLDVPEYVYLDYSLVVAGLAGLACWILLFRHRFGFELRALGASVDVARYAGIKVGRIGLGAFLASGALAGLVGLQEVCAIRGFYTYEIASGLGFDGIAIALIGRNSPAGVLVAAVLFAFLKQAGYGMQLYTAIPNSVIHVITGLMILIIVVANKVTARWLRGLRKKEAH